MTDNPIVITVNIYQNGGRFGPDNWLEICRIAGAINKICGIPLDRQLLTSWCSYPNFGTKWNILYYADADTNSRVDLAWGHGGAALLTNFFGVTAKGLDVFCALTGAIMARFPRRYGVWSSGQVELWRPGIQWARDHGLDAIYPANICPPIPPKVLTRARRMGLSPVEQRQLRETMAFLGGASHVDAG